MTRHPLRHGNPATTTELFGTIGKARLACRPLATIEAIARRVAPALLVMEPVPMRR